jgi:hypothetical protein
MRSLREGDRHRKDQGEWPAPSETINAARRKTSRKKKLITKAGAPVVDNRKTMTAGPRGPDSSLFNESQRKEQ